jgi:hypothetical protein
MKLSQVAPIITPFVENTTGVSRYDDWLRNPEVAKNEGFSYKIDHITPQQYIDACCYGFKCSPQQLSQRNDTGKINKYAQDMQRGDKFPMLVLSFAYGGQFTQEGIHRALAAQQVKVDKVPVMIITES